MNDTQLLFLFVINLFIQLAAVIGLLVVPFDNNRNKWKTLTGCFIVAIIASSVTICIDRLWYHQQFHELICSSAIASEAVKSHCRIWLDWQY